MSAGAKGAVRWSAHAILRRSGVAGASRLINPLPSPAASRALYTASCIANHKCCLDWSALLMSYKARFYVQRPDMLPLTKAQLTCSAAQGGAGIMQAKKMQAPRKCRPCPQPCR